MATRDVQLKTRENPAEGNTKPDFSSMTNEELYVLLLQKVRLAAFRVGDWNRETAISALQMLLKMNGD